MSEQTSQHPELTIAHGQVNFNEDQLKALRNIVVDEIVPVVLAREVRQKVGELAQTERWSEKEVLHKDFMRYLDGGEVPFRDSLAYDGKVLNFKDLYMPVELELQTTDPAIYNKQIGMFHLEAINMEDGRVIISSPLKRGDRSECDLKGENEGWFSFIVDPGLAEQSVEMLYLPKDDNAETTYQALLPVLVGEQTISSASSN